MVEYNDITKYASKAYANALLENEQHARDAAMHAVTNLGLTQKIAQEVVNEVAERHLRQNERTERRLS